jgi:hypothetical protein
MNPLLSGLDRAHVETPLYSATQPLRSAVRQLAEFQQLDAEGLDLREHSMTSSLIRERAAKNRAVAAGLSLESGKRLQHHFPEATTDADLVSR